MTDESQPAQSADTPKTDEINVENSPTTDVKNDTESGGTIANTKVVDTPAAPAEALNVKQKWEADEEARMAALNSTADPWDEAAPANVGLDTCILCSDLTL
jgi:hypothetical protein